MTFTHGIITGGRALVLVLTALASAAVAHANQTGKWYNAQADTVSEQDCPVLRVIERRYVLEKAAGAMTHQRAHGTYLHRLRPILSEAGSLKKHGDATHAS